MYDFSNIYNSDVKVSDDEIKDELEKIIHDIIQCIQFIILGKTEEKAMSDAEIKSLKTIAYNIGVPLEEIKYKYPYEYIISIIDILLVLSLVLS